jgi:hypothetical protein
MKKKIKDDLGDFLQSDQATRTVEIQILKNKNVNLIDEAEKESEQVAEISSRKKAGRKKIEGKEPATVQVAGYVTKSVKDLLTSKRGLVAESKVISNLVEQYINGYIDVK